MEKEMKFITLWFNGMGILISTDYALLHNLKNNYRVSNQDELFKILAGHAEYQIKSIVAIN